uniref:Uncharacterized protein n=1 Tax=virus sp. ctSf81 TaxID=2826803 RepID=A0A8S5NDB1_9VIRU|nr:MAG TPA: hypothetical protein [virus sp. ctSf81]
MLCGVVRGSEREKTVWLWCVVFRGVVLCEC